MTIKEYLSQAWRMEERIQAKFERIWRWRSIAEKVTQTYSGMPRDGKRDKAEILARILDAERELDKEIDRLIMLQSDIRITIQSVPDATERMILELRYLNYMTWEEIGERMILEVRWLHRLHNRAIKKVIPKTDHRNTHLTYDIV